MADADTLVAATKPAQGKAAPATGPGQATSLALSRNPKPAAFANGAGAFPQGASAYGT